MCMHSKVVSASDQTTERSGGNDGLRPQDVMTGRGIGSRSEGRFHHEGNQAFRRYVLQNFEAYHHAPNNAAKKQVANQVMRAVAEKNGRFMRYSQSSGGWVEIKERDVVESKVRQALRQERTRELMRRGLEATEPTPDAEQQQQQQPQRQEKWYPTREPPPPHDKQGRPWSYAPYPHPYHNHHCREYYPPPPPDRRQRQKEHKEQQQPPPSPPPGHHHWHPPHWHAGGGYAPYYYPSYHHPYQYSRDDDETRNSQRRYDRAKRGDHPMKMAASYRHGPSRREESSPSIEETGTRKRTCAEPPLERQFDQEAKRMRSSRRPKSLSEQSISRKEGATTIEYNGKGWRVKHATTTERFRTQRTECDDSEHYEMPRNTPQEEDKKEDEQEQEKYGWSHLPRDKGEKAPSRREFSGATTKGGQGRCKAYKSDRMQDNNELSDECSVGSLPPPPEPKQPPQLSREQKKKSKTSATEKRKAAHSGLGASKQQQPPRQNRQAPLGDGKKRAVPKNTHAVNSRHRASQQQQVQQLQQQNPQAPLVDGRGVPLNSDAVNSMIQVLKQRLEIKNQQAPLGNAKGAPLNSDAFTHGASQQQQLQQQNAQAPLVDGKGAPLNSDAVNSMIQVLKQQLGLQNQQAPLGNAKGVPLNSDAVTHGASQQQQLQQQNPQAPLVDGSINPQLQPPQQQQLGQEKQQAPLGEDKKAAPENSEAVQTQLRSTINSQALQPQQLPQQNQQPSLGDGKTRTPQNGDAVNSMIQASLQQQLSKQKQQASVRDHLDFILHSCCLVSHPLDDESYLRFLASTANQECSPLQMHLRASALQTQPVLQQMVGSVPRLGAASHGAPSVVGLTATSQGVAALKEMGYINVLGGMTPADNSLTMQHLTLKFLSDNKICLPLL